MVKKTKEKQVIREGRIYVSSTFNNTVCTITDLTGKPLAVGSCGMFGFSGTRKSTPYAASTTVAATLKKVVDNHQLAAVTVFIKGIGFHTMEYVLLKNAEDKSYAIHRIKKQISTTRRN
jgi:small subunit ribosomal protein S11